MRKYIILIAYKEAISFCNYKATKHNDTSSEFIPIKIFNEAINYAKSHDLILNIVLGKERLPKEYIHILKDVSYTLLVPLELLETYPEAIPVIDFAGQEIISLDFKRKAEIVIIRLSVNDIQNIKRVISQLAGISRRINLVLKDIESLSEEKLAVYQYQLNKLIPFMIKLYQGGNSLEVNCISDRFLLDEMNNCNAGLEHITLAPNGKFYICPGFYYSNPENDIGTIKNGENIPNKELLHIENAPICSVCDAFQCKRCVYLNKEITKELNTPSQQQCILSHIERNTSRSLFKQLKKSILNYSEFEDIPEIDYLDPIENIVGKKQQNRIKIYRECRKEL